MKRFMLANHPEKGGRLYWSTQRGWTYKELASIYKTKDWRETITPAKDPTWFEIETDFRGIITVIEPSAEQRTGMVRGERPDFAGGKDALNAIGDLANDALWTPSKPLPDMLIVCRGYNVNVYRKAAS
jgi:hypothetical protein